MGLMGEAQDDDRKDIAELVINEMEVVELSGHYFINLPA